METLTAAGMRAGAGPVSQQKLDPLLDLGNLETPLAPSFDVSHAPTSSVGRRYCANLAPCGSFGQGKKPALWLGESPGEPVARPNGWLRGSGARTVAPQIMRGIALVKNLEAQITELKRGAVDLIQEAELRRRIERGGRSRSRRVRPTAPDLHLGHTVLINKLRQFQQFGHDVIFLIGDFTGMIGDPTGKNATRPRLTADEIARNARTYQEQIFKILDPKLTRIEFNSTWMGKMTAAG